MTTVREGLAHNLRTARLDPRLPANVCLSGGAKGRDRAWGDAAATAGHRVIHWLHREPHAAASLPLEQRALLRPEQLLRADSQLAAANETLNRRWPSNSDFVNGLLRRNFYQIEHTERLYAVGELDNNGMIEGGTSWAVQMYLDRYPVGELWFLDQQARQWWGRRNGDWYSLGRSHPPPPHGVWTGIGTRKLLEDAATIIPALVHGDLTGQLVRHPRP